MGYLFLTTGHLRLLQRGDAQNRPPRLASLGRLYLDLESLGLNRIPQNYDYDAELDSHLDTCLPILAGLFGAALRYIEIQFNHPTRYLEESGRRLLNRRLGLKMARHFPRARTCKGEIYPGIRMRHWNHDVTACLGTPEGDRLSP